MANLSKIKRRNVLGAPPSPDEASQNLSAPEIAPHADDVAPSSPALVAPGAPVRIDGRSLRRTNRTVQFATKVSPEYDDKLRRIAMRDGLNLCVLLEKSLDAYEEARRKLTAS